MATKQETMYTYEDPETKNRKTRKGVTYATPQDVPVNTKPKADMSATATPQLAKTPDSVLRGKSYARPDQAALMREYESLGDELTAPNRTAETIRTATTRRAQILGLLDRDEQGRVRVPQGVNRTEYGFDYSGARRENVVPGDPGQIKPTPPANNRVMGADGKFHPMTDEELNKISAQLGENNKPSFLRRLGDNETVKNVWGAAGDREFWDTMGGDLKRLMGLDDSSSNNPVVNYLKEDAPYISAAYKAKSPGLTRAIDRAGRDFAEWLDDDQNFLRRVDAGLNTYADTGTFKMPPKGAKPATPNSPLDLSSIDVAPNQDPYDILRRAQAGEPIASIELGIVEQLKEQGFLDQQVQIQRTTSSAASSTPRTAGSSTTIYKNEDGSYSDTPLNNKSVVWKPSSNQAMGSSEVMPASGITVYKNEDGSYSNTPLNNKSVVWKRSSNQAMGSSGVMPASQNLLRSTPSLPGRSYTSGGRGTGEPFMINRTGPDLRGMSNSMINQLANAKRAEIFAAQQRRMAGGAATGGNLLSQVSRLYDQAQKTEADALRKGMDVYAAKSLGDGLRGKADALLEAQKDSTTRRGQDMTYDIGMTNASSAIEAARTKAQAEMSDREFDMRESMMENAFSYTDKDGKKITDWDRAFRGAALLGIDNLYGLSAREFSQVAPRIQQMATLMRNFENATNTAFNMDLFMNGNTWGDINWSDVWEGRIGIMDKIAEIFDFAPGMRDVTVMDIPGVGPVRLDIIMEGYTPSIQERSSILRKPRNER